MSHVEYMRWISEAARAQKGDYKEQYGGAHMKYSRDETNVHFRKMVNMVPWDIMRFVKFQIPFCNTDVAYLYVNYSYFFLALFLFYVGQWKLNDCKGK